MEGLDTGARVAETGLDDWLEVAVGSPLSTAVHAGGVGKGPKGKVHSGFAIPGAVTTGLPESEARDGLLSRHTEPSPAARACTKVTQQAAGG